MRHDVTFPLYVEVDEIYNLACPASPIHYQHDPVQTTKTSVHGAINMLGLAKRCARRSSRPRPARSTATRGASAAEDYWGHVNPIGPRSCYDEGKRCAETLFFDYHRQHSCRSRSRASSTPTARACTRTTAAWSPTSSSRRCAARRSDVRLLRRSASRITLYGDGIALSRRARSASSTIWSLPARIVPAIEWMRARRIRPMLAHPERIREVQANVEALAPLVAAGLLLQVDADALAGGCGPYAQEAARALLQRGWVQALASNAHDLVRQPPRIEPGRIAAAELLGEAESWQLVSKRPARIAAMHFPGLTPA
jgi:hypothetical protein